MATTPGAAPAREQRGLPPRAPRRPGDLVFSGASIGSGILILLALAGVAFFLVQQAIPALTADPEDVTGELNPGALPAPQDQELLKKLVTFPEMVERAAREREPHRITGFLHELATVVHGWYHHTRAVGAPEGPETEHARLLLARAARIVLSNALRLLGISAPDRM